MSSEQQKPIEYSFDASGRILGKLAAEIVVCLRGKNQPAFLPYLTPQNQVVVFNTNKIKVTGKKLDQKTYHRHSGYPGGLREEKLKDLLARDSRKVVWLAVYGMLPKNRTRDKIMKNLKLFKGEK